MSEHSERAGDDTRRDEAGASPREPERFEPSTWVTVPDVAEALGVRVTRVHQMIRQGTLLGVRRDAVMRVPAELAPSGPDDQLLKHLAGVLRLLHDAGYSDEEALGWLYTPDDSLPGTPAAALRSGRATEVKRRAQALGF